MSDTAIWWLLLTLLFIFSEAFFAMMEMACVSFNRVRLQYYATQGNRRALWLKKLLENPARLFGTTLLCVNLSLQVGSECSRLLYASLGLSAGLAPLTQVVLVLVLAELSPMFAARRYAEHIALLGVPLLYTASLVLQPLTWALGILSKGVNLLIGSKASASDFFINREELQHILEEEDDDPSKRPNTQDFSTTVSNIFSLQGKTAGQTMEPLSGIAMLPNTCSVADVQELLAATPTQAYVPLYHRTRRNIVGVLLARDLIKSEDHQPAAILARSPWFLTRSARIFRVLKQFRQNNQTVAVVVGDKGGAIGLLTLDSILSEIFVKNTPTAEQPTLEERKSVTRFIEKSFPGHMRISDFNAQFGGQLPGTDGETLWSLFCKQLGHEPTVGDTARLGPYELKLVKNPLVGPKMIYIQTLF